MRIGRANTSAVPSSTGATLEESRYDSDAEELEFEDQGSGARDVFSLAYLRIVTDTHPP
jgi:hypothetical protein